MKYLLIFLLWIPNVQAGVTPISSDEEDGLKEGATLEEEIGQGFTAQNFCDFGTNNEDNPSDGSGGTAPVPNSADSETIK